MDFAKLYCCYFIENIYGSRQQPWQNLTRDRNKTRDEPKQSTRPNFYYLRCADFFEIYWSPAHFLRMISVTKLTTIDLWNTTHTLDIFIFCVQRRIGLELHKGVSHILFAARILSNGRWADAAISVLCDFVLYSMCGIAVLQFLENIANCAGFHQQPRSIQLSAFRDAHLFGPWGAAVDANGDEYGFHGRFRLASECDRTEDTDCIQGYSENRRFEGIRF